jgi:hydrogenase expression/formation protein HypE
VRVVTTTSGAACPIPIDRYPIVTMAHGGGGRLMRDLIDRMMVATFANDSLSAGHDASVLDLPTRRIAMTTDSFVVHPLFFPGGDIGSLAVNGTVNDVAMAGARPLYLSLGMILAEGLPMGTLWTVVQSIRAAADVAGVQIVTGDTKVVERNQADQMYLNTTGVGVIEHERVISPASVREGDVVILSGDVGRHGVAILSAREGLEFETTIESDCAPLNASALSVVRRAGVHCLRDLTRGGLAAALDEIGSTAGVTIEIDEISIPVLDEVRGACEMLGLEAIHVANEGRYVCIVPEVEAAAALQAMRGDPESADAVVVGRVTARDVAPLVQRTQIGVVSVVDIPTGEQLPRIC